MKVKVIKDKDLIIDGVYQPIGKILNYPEDFANRLIKNGSVSKVEDRKKHEEREPAPKNIFAKKREVNNA